MEKLAARFWLSHPAKGPRRGQGRVATKSAYEHLGVEYNEQTQPRLL